jgi:hypothetical protein
MFCSAPEMTTVSNPNRNPASAAVKEQKNNRLRIVIIPCQAVEQAQSATWQRKHPGLCAGSPFSGWCL